MFITWDEKVTTSRGAETRKGIVATRGTATDHAYHVTATARPNAAFAKVSVKRGAHGKNLVTDHVVPADKVNGNVLAVVRSLEAAASADGALLVIEHETAEGGVAEVRDGHGDLAGDVDLEEVGEEAVGVIVPDADDEADPDDDTAE